MITQSGNYDMPVTVCVKIASSAMETFGSLTDPIAGNVNDGHNPRHSITRSLHQAGSAVSIGASSWIKTHRSMDGSTQGHWQTHLAVESPTATQQVKVLRNGDRVPNSTPFMNQATIVSFVHNYIDVQSQRLRLGSDEAIYLFELGTTNMSSSAVDFQDLAILVSLARDPVDLGGHQPAASRLIEVDHRTVEMTVLMPLTRRYTGLAARSSARFFSCSRSDIYALDPVAQTETLIGTIPMKDQQALDMAGSDLYAFGVIVDRLTGVDVTTLHALGKAFNLGIEDLRTMVFM